MARTLEEYLQEQQKYTDVGRKAVLDQLSNMPQQQAADESALNAQVDRQYKAIEAGANRKGNFYSGIPVAEKQSYLATDFAPALANLKSQNVARKATLEATLADLGRQDYTNAFNMYNTDRTFAEEQRRYEEQKAAQEAATRAQNDWYAKLYGQQQATLQQQQAVQAPKVDPVTVQRESDAQYLGRIAAEPDPIVRQRLFNSLASGNLDAKRRYQLAVQLYPQYFQAPNNKGVTYSGGVGNSMKGLSF